MARKQAYIEHLQHAPEDVLLVSACDKLHNARAIVQDLGTPGVGIKVFERFTGGQQNSLGYYHSLSQIFTRCGCKPALVFDAVVDRMHQLAGVSHRQPLVIA